MTTTEATDTGTTLATDAPAGGETVTQPAGQGTEEGGQAANAEATTATEQSEAPPEKPVVPEKYEFKAPDGFTADPETLGSYEGLAKEAGLTQEQFEKVTDFGLKYFQDQLGKQAEAQSARVVGWQNEALSDRDLSDGKKLLPDVMQNTSRVLDNFGGDDLRKALVDTGAGNHPAVIRALNLIGKAMGAADAPDFGKPAAQSRGNSFEDVANRLFGKGS